MNWIADIFIPIVASVIPCIAMFILMILANKKDRQKLFESYGERMDSFEAKLNEIIESMKEHDYHKIKDDLMDVRTNCRVVQEKRMNAINSLRTQIDFQNGMIIDLKQSLIEISSIEKNLISLTESIKSQSEKIGELVAIVKSHDDKIRDLEVNNHNTRRIK